MKKTIPILLLALIAAAAIIFALVANNRGNSLQADLEKLKADTGTQFEEMKTAGDAALAEANAKVEELTASAEEAAACQVGSVRCSVHQNSVVASLFGVLRGPAQAALAK